MGGPSVRDALEAMRRLRIAVVGDPILDVYTYGQTVRVSREAPVLVVRREHTEYRLGGAANCAANLAALGVHTMFVGDTGDDEAGHRLRGLLAQIDVDVAQLGTLGTETAVKTRVLAGAHGTGRQQVLRIDDEPASDPGPLRGQSMLARLKLLRGQVDAILLSDYGFGGVIDGAVDLFLGWKDRPHIGADSRARLAAFRGVDIVTPNLPEAEALLGRSLRTEEAILEGGALLQQRLEVQLCLLTRGKDGMTLFGGGMPRTMRVVGKSEVTDVTGAGDTVASVFMAAVAAGLGAGNAMALANAAAGYAVQRLGAAVVPSGELESYVHEQGVALEPWE